MQAVTRNPLADPGILGVSGGAALAVVIGIVFFGLADPYAYLVVAIIGAAVAAVFVYSVGSLGRGGATPLKLALAGAAISAAFASLISAVLLPRVDVDGDLPVLADRRRGRRDMGPHRDGASRARRGRGHMPSVRARHEFARARR